MEDIALAREELPSGPVGTYPIELFAYPPPRQIGGAIPSFSQEERRTGDILITGRLRGTLRQGTADALFFGGVAAQFAEMLTGAAFDGHRLISPSRTTAGID